jgi:hypothetical protein
MNHAAAYRAPPTLNLGMHRVEEMASDDMKTVHLTIENGIHHSSLALFSIIAFGFSDLHLKLNSEAIN